MQLLIFNISYCRLYEHKLAVIH